MYCIKYIRFRVISAKSINLKLSFHLPPRLRRVANVKRNVESMKDRAIHDPDVLMT